MSVCGSPKLPFDASRIKWQDRQNEKGKFQFSEDFDSPDYRALLKFLNEYTFGSMSSEGWFYWVYPRGDRIGRKVKSK